MAFIYSVGFGHTISMLYTQTTEDIRATLEYTERSGVRITRCATARSGPGSRSSEIAVGRCRVAYLSSALTNNCFVTLVYSVKVMSYSGKKQYVVER